MAEVFLALGESARAFEQFRQAGERFWMADKRFIAFGLGTDKRQITSVASNAGHCLATGHHRQGARRRRGAAAHDP
jgi:hypothetical protein